MKIMKTNTHSIETPITIEFLCHSGDHNQMPIYPLNPHNFLTIPHTMSEEFLNEFEAIDPNYKIIAQTDVNDYSYIIQLTALPNELIKFARYFFNANINSIEGLKNYIL